MEVHDAVEGGDVVGCEGGVLCCEGEGDGDAGHAWFWFWLMAGGTFGLLGSPQWGVRIVMVVNEMSQSKVRLSFSVTAFSTIATASDVASLSPFAVGEDQIALRMRCRVKQK